MRTRHAVAASTLLLVVAAGAVAVTTGHDQRSPDTPAAAPVVQKTPDVAMTYFSPPSAASMPTDDFGRMVRLGEQIFQTPKRYAPAFVGNQLACSNCHLEAGRRANSAPLWAAYVAYPAYRAKNGHVNTFEERLQGCFRFSMNGKAPPLGDRTLVALESYARWLASGATIDDNLPGRGYPAVDQPPLPADYARGQTFYAANCALCHAKDGAGQQNASGEMTFPPLWGPRSFNWGAGMGSITSAAAFIQANMPLGRGNTLTDQQAWDVATYMDSHDRPQDPCFDDTVEATRVRFHGSDNSLYGRRVNGHVLGSRSVPAGGTLSKEPSH